MDLTHIFKASVLMAKSQRKGELPSKVLDKNCILGKSTAKSTAATPTTATTATSSQRDEFARQAKDICQKITALRDVLIDNRAAYLRIGQHLKSAAQMTDEQRDLIDRESEKFFTFYTQQLALLRSDWKHVKRKPQHMEHVDAVIKLLADYLRIVQNIHIQQRKLRVQQELEANWLLKLAPDKNKIPVRPASGNSGRRSKDASSVAFSDLYSDTSGDDDDDEDDDFERIEGNNNNDTASSRHMDDYGAEDHHEGSHLRRRLTKDRKLNLSTSSADGKLSQSQTSQKVALDEDIQKSQQLVDEEAKAVNGLSPEDLQILEKENKHLYQEMQGLVQDVEEIEKNVVEIAQLQDIFTEKVSLQQHNIERIANVVVGATENVKDANEQIRQAIQRNAGLRVWSLFFMLVMSFALLFLDWYYD